LHTKSLIVGGLLGVSGAVMMWMLVGSDDEAQSPTGSRVSTAQPTPSAAAVVSRGQQPQDAEPRGWREQYPSLGGRSPNLYSYPQPADPSHGRRGNLPGPDERYRFRPLNEREKQRMQAAAPYPGYYDSGLPQAYPEDWGANLPLQQRQHFRASEHLPRLPGEAAEGYRPGRRGAAPAPRRDWSGPAFEPYGPPRAWDSPYQHNSLQPSWEHTGRYSAR
jgi:hypothetical protein